MKTCRATALVAVVVVALVVTMTQNSQVAEAATCNPIQLSPCASAITSASPPTALCCTRIRQQRSCLCGYLRDPRFRRFIANPNAKKVANRCRTPFPRC